MAEGDGVWTSGLGVRRTAEASGLGCRAWPRTRVQDTGPTVEGVGSARQAVAGRRGSGHRAMAEDTRNAGVGAPGLQGA